MHAHNPRLIRAARKAHAPRRGPSVYPGVISMPLASQEESECLRCGQRIPTSEVRRARKYCSHSCKRASKKQRERIKSKKRFSFTSRNHKQLELFHVREVTHGTKWLYDKRRCRCDNCRRAASAYSAQHSKFKCTRCGGPTQSKKEGAVCHPCRKKRREHRPGTKTTWTCRTCGKECYHQKPSGHAFKFCSIKCAAIGNRKDPELLVDPYNRRASKRPGLSSASRNKLLHRWQRQQRSCFYCAGPCESVDHVIPIARGGTNFEGNLVPCCRTCNSSKGKKLLVEWRLRRGSSSTQAA